MTKLTEADRVQSFSTRAECPMVLTLSMPSSDTIHAFDAVNVTWTVQADFSSANAINNTRLFFGPEMSGRIAQIVHSNIHTCVFGTGCDPFNDGKEMVDKTVNKIANFTDNKATFSDTLQFPQPGEYSVLAHIILPNANASSRFDYAVYSRVVVLEARPQTVAPPAAVTVPTPAPAANSASGHSGLSQGATIAIVIGAIIVLTVVDIIVVIYLRRRRDDRRHSNRYVQAPIHDAGVVGGGSGICPSNAGMKQSEVTDTNSTTGFQSAWGGQHRPSGLDNTNHSNASSGSNGVNQYAAPRPSDPRASEMNNQQFTSSMHQPEMSASAYFGNPSLNNSQGTRKKRVESDLEL
jgi:hypothetical protein